MRRLALFMVFGVLPCGVAVGQSLYEQPVSGPPLRGASVVALAPSQAHAEPSQAPAPEVPLTAVSLYAVEPPKPREFAEHDLVTIIISERNKFERDQSLDTQKNYDNRVAIDSFIDLMKLLELRVETNSRQPILNVDLNARQRFKGEGEYEREDRMTARVTARVLEIKPNGTLLLEARTSLVTDAEEQIITLSGLCRAEDVTNANTVQSNQIFDLRLDVQHSGQVKKTSKKGLIPQVVETILNF